MQQMTPVPVAQQVQQISQQLTTELLRKSHLQDELAACEKRISAVQNVLAGIELGRRLEQAVAAEAADKEPQAN